jgi:hypothetical protein
MSGKKTDSPDGFEEFNFPGYDEHGEKHGHEEHGHEGFDEFDFEMPPEPPSSKRRAVSGDEAAFGDISDHHDQGEYDVGQESADGEYVEGQENEEVNENAGEQPSSSQGMKRFLFPGIAAVFGAGMLFLGYNLFLTGPTTPPIAQHQQGAASSVPHLPVIPQMPQQAQSVPLLPQTQTPSIPNVAPVGQQSVSSDQALIKVVDKLGQVADHLDSRLSEFQKQIGGALNRVDDKLVDIGGHLNTLDSRMNALEGRLNAIETMGSTSPPAHAVQPVAGSLPVIVHGRSRSDTRRVHRIRSQEEAPSLSTSIHGYALRGVSKDAVLIDTPSGQVETKFGGDVPGLGKVISVRREGDHYSLVTDHGLIRAVGH